MTVPFQSETPFERVVGMLEGVKRSKTGVVAKCPAHDDRSPSLSVSEGPTGKVLLWDWAGCSTDDIRKALGLEWSDLFPDNDKRIRPNREKRRSEPVPDAIFRGLYRRETFPKEWPVIKRLASVPVELATQDVEANRDHLRSIGVDPLFVWRMANEIRGIALLQFGNRRDPYKYLAQSVDRLCEIAGKAVAA